MSSANGNDITESFNSIRDDDDLCVSCGKHGCASKSNLCKVCQKGMGIKKISARRLAQLGWTAEESFGAEKNPHHYVKGTGGTPYVGDCDACGSKGSLLEDTRTLHIITCDKCGAFEEELFDAESFDAEDCEGCGLPNDGKCDCTIDLEYCTTCDKDVGSKNLRKCNCGGAVCKGCDYCEMCGNDLDAESFGAEEDVGVGSEKWRKEPKAWKMFNGFWIDNIWGQQHDTAQEAVALYDDEVGQGLGIEVPTTPYQRMLDAGLKPQSGTEVYGNAESFDAEESSKGLPWMTFALIGLGAFVASRIKTVNFKASADCGCGCSGAGGCGDEKKADEGHYPNTYDPVQDFLPRYRYPEDSDWSNSYNPTDPYRPLDYQTVQTDTRVTADRM